MPVAGSRARSHPALVLALPFLVGIAALRGLTATLTIFHSDDEFNYHLPTIHQFAAGLPFPSLAHYPAAQTPLFHLVMAVAGKLIGFALWRLRLVEVVVSWLLALAVYQLLRRGRRLPPRIALGLALLVALSPYVFGAAFRVITDNLALLWIVLAVERFEAARRSRRLAPYAAGAACAGLAVLTRQSAAFVFALGVLYLPLVRRRPAAVAVLGAAALPAVVLFLSWGGLVPPGGDPRSCGLCGQGTGLSAGLPELTLATVGLYGAVLFGRRSLGRRDVPAAVAGGVLLLLAPAPGSFGAGVLWNAARHLPALLGTPIVFWTLVPLGAAVLSGRLRAARDPWPAAAFALSFLLGALGTRYAWQKYADPFALLILLLTVRPRDFRQARSWLGAAALALAFVGYTVDTAAHRDRQASARIGTATYVVRR